MNRTRLDYMDIAKGILIMLTVLGHVFPDGFVHNWLYTFHMPAFFVITGMLLNYASSLDKPLYKFIFSRIRTFIVPLLFFEVIGAVTNTILYGRTLNVFGYTYNTITGNFNTGADWFLFAAFAAQFFFILLHKMLKNKYAIIAGTVLLALFMICNPVIFPKAGQTGVGLLFIASGYYAGNLFETDRIGSTIMSFAVTVLIAAVNGATDIYAWIFGFAPLYAIGTIAGTLLILSISKHISCKLLRFFGVNSLIIMGTHQAVLFLIRKFSGMAVFPIPIGILIFIGITALEIPIIHVLNKYVPFLVGKKHS